MQLLQADIFKTARWT